jgi:hypothetical protein
LDEPIIVNCNQDSDKIISIDILKEYIKFESNGIFICLEKVGEIDYKRNVINKKFPRPAFLYSNKKSKDFSVSKSFYKDKSSSVWKEIDIRKFGYKKNIYLAIQLELATYED